MAVDRHQRLAAGMGDEMRFARRLRLGPGRRVVNDVGRGDQVRRAAGKAPASVFFNPDRDRIVALGIEVLKNGCRRCQRDLMLSGAAAVDDADA